MPSFPPRCGDGHDGPRALGRGRGLPAWAQTAAALLFLGVSAGIANLDVHYDHSGLTSAPDGHARRCVRSPDSAAPVAVCCLAPRRAPWRADLTALERQLRTEFHGAPPAPAVRDAATAAAADDAAARSRAVEDSERRQQNELALRIAELAGEWESKRKSDLKNIDWNLQAIQKDTGFRMVAGQKQMRAYIDNTATIMSRTQQR